MQSKFLILLAGVAMLGVLGVALLNQPSVTYTPPVADATASTQSPPANVGVAQPAASRPSQPQPQSSQPTPAAPAPSGYTMATVARHNSASSCWTAINGNVYDLTQWINQHPGGQDAILSLCGTDGSAAFNAQHGGQRRPEQELANFKLGPLAG